MGKGIKKTEETEVNICEVATEQESVRDTNRRDFIVLTASAMTAVGVGSFLWPVVDTLNPSSEVLALSKSEIDLSQIKEGQTVKVVWQNKPVFIRCLTDAEIEAEKSVPMSDLKDPQSFADRVKKDHEKWLVMVGVCTHLGCIPIAGKGDYNGFFCPCHGSDYDGLGRIRKGPAPHNLAIPPYSFVSNNKIIIG